VTRWRAYRRVGAGVALCAGRLIVPRHPSRGVRGKFGGMPLSGEQILERSDVIELNGVDQAHEHVTDVGAGEGSIEQGIFPVG
jgi:hypothetical protein